jgi:hypothetical protein
MELPTELIEGVANHRAIGRGRGAAVGQRHHTDLVGRQQLIQVFADGLEGDTTAAGWNLIHIHQQHQRPGRDGAAVGCGARHSQVGGRPGGLRGAHEIDADNAPGFLAGHHGEVLCRKAGDWHPRLVERDHVHRQDIDPAAECRLLLRSHGAAKKARGHHADTRPTATHA